MGRFGHAGQGLVTKQACVLSWASLEVPPGVTDLHHVEESMILPWIEGKPQKNTMFMVCAQGSEGKLVDAASFPFHDYFPVNAPEPMRPSLMNG